MNAFQWDPCFVTGLAKVDVQHRELVNIMNQYGDSLMKSTGASQEEVDHVFGELADYAKYHFNEEEAMMRTSGVDGRHIKSHIQAHVKFLDDVTTMHMATDRANRESASNLLTYLTNWLAYHILGMDKNMARLMTAIKAGRTSREAYLGEQRDSDPATTMLLRSMTILFDQVSERNRALSELNQTLEARVELRTSELAIMAMTDVLTGLPNRRHAMRCLEQCWQESEKAGTPLACMMIDADGFKIINDSYGHAAGDEVLFQLARCLKQSVRNDDVVCRLGGDEFLIICDHTTLSGAMTTAENIRVAVSELRVPAGAAFWSGSVSIGVAERTPTMEVCDDLLKLADSAVYEAKRAGRNRVASVHSGGSEFSRNELEDKSEAQ